MAGLGNHNRNCERASGHICKCTGCGGSLHGYGGWLDIAEATGEERQENRKRLEDDWQRHYRPDRKKANKDAKGAGIDLARLDIADWLARHRAPRRAPERPDPRASDLHPNSPDPSNTPEPPPSSAAASAQTADGVERVRAVAEGLTRTPWPEIAADLAADPSGAGREISRELAQHFWCDLLVGLIQIVQASQDLATAPRDAIKKKIRKAVEDSSKQAGRPLITTYVIDKVVDKAWSSMTVALLLGHPLLIVLTGDELLRTLRIFCVFICPAPEDHAEVREHALEPLGDDARHILQDQTKEALRKAFDGWATPKLPGV